MILRIAFAAFIVLVFMMIFATPVYAEDEPDSAPTLESVNCYRNILETGDFLIIVYANIPYAIPPDTPVDEAFIWRLFDTDGETELGQTLGYPYNQNGYGYNVYAFYFDASGAPDWGEEYYLTLSGTPIAFDDPPEYNYQIQSADYSSLTDTDAVQVAIAALIIQLGQDLDVNWGLDSDESLLLEIETGTVLSIYGEAFFRGAIYGLQALAPAAFRLIIGEVDVEDRAWDTEYSENLTSQWEGTWMGDAFDSMQSFFDVDYNLVGIMITFCLCMGMLLANIIIAGDVWGGLVDATIPFIFCAKLGFYGIGFLGLLAAMCFLYIASRIWGIGK